MKLKIYHLQQEQCVGCQDHIANQLGHDCLFHTHEDVMELYFTNAFNMLDTTRLKNCLLTYLQKEFCGNAKTRNNISNYFEDENEDVDQLLSRFYEPEKTDLNIFNDSEDDEEQQQEEKKTEKGGA